MKEEQSNTMGIIRAQEQIKIAFFTSYKACNFGLFSDLASSTSNVHIEFSGYSGSLNANK